MTPPRLVTRGLRRAFATGDGIVEVLRGIDLVIEPGECVAICGASGCGKSTLVNILGSLDRAYTGSCRVGDTELSALGDEALAQLRRRVFGFVFQDFGLVPVLTCAENIRLPAAYDGVAASAQDALADRLLGEFGLQHRAQRYPETLSGGERQRVAIARALVNGAPVIIADEPTGSLDSASARAVMDLLLELNRQGRTVVLVTHAPELARQAGRIVELADGRIIGERAGTDAARAAAAAATDVPPCITGTLRLADALRLVPRTLKRRRLQSALTALGIAIGTASVIALATVGDGARRQVVERIEALGSNLVTISRGPPGVRGGERLVTSLVAEDMHSLATVRGIAAIAPEMDGVFVVKHRAADYLVTITGTSGQFPQVRDWPPSAGVFFDDEAVQRYAPVAVLGATAASNLAGSGISPVGGYILIDNAPYRVVGVMERKGITTGPGHDRDNQIWIPYTTAGARLFGRRYLDRIVLKIGSGSDAEALAAEIRARLRTRHGREDFSVNTLAEIIRTATRAQRTLDYFLAAIAAISLLVGGVGVMNIMLASVNERIREIGIRMAVGATRQAVRAQFLFEGVALCLIGCAVGLLLGLVAVVMTAAWAGIPVQLTAMAFIAAAGSALAVGLVFGVAPASQAAAIDPAAAFRRTV